MRPLLVGVVLLVFLATGCGDKAGTTSGPAGPSSPTVTSVTITGGMTIGSGLTSQLTATAHFAKGTSLNVTTQASWSSSDAAVAAVSATGLVTASNAGNATITATYQNAIGTTRVTVTRAPTYTVSGLITESTPTTSTVLAGARVEFTDGVNQGRFATTDGTGRYQITQVPAGTFNVRATLSGYVDATKQLVLNANTSLDFALAPTPQQKNTSFSGSISGADVVCYNGQPCRVFTLPPVHNAGPLIATLLWPADHSDVFLALQLFNVDTGQVIASASATGQTNQFLTTSIPAPGNYQMRVVAITIPRSTTITVNVTSYPN